jgi:hypothetical protein
MTFYASCMEGFDRRMRFLAMAVAIVRRTGRNMELERLFDDQEMDSLIMAVLVFAMEETLSENRDCTLVKISQFLDRLITNVKPDFPQERLRDLTEYIVKTVLKNDGEPRYYTLLHPEKGFQRVRVDFLADSKEEMPASIRIHYQLTDQAYDFLFRTKEVDSELRFTMEELKLRELIRRKNYGEAIRQSAGLVQMIRQKKRELQQFLDRVRDNVLTVDVGEFETLYRSTFDLLDDEYGTMREIRDMLHLAYVHLQEQMTMHDMLDKEMAKALAEVERIRRNLDMAVAEQQTMILERYTVSELYGDVMKEAFSRRILNRFDMGKEILKPMMRMDATAMKKVGRLLNPLFLPEPSKWLGVGAAYAPQQKLRIAEETAPGISFDGLEEDFEAAKVRMMNGYHISFVDGLLQYAAQHPGGFRLDELHQWLESRENRERQPDGNTLFQAVMRLYEAGVVDVAAWKAERPEVAENATGEFDLEYCLHRVERERPDMHGISLLRLSWPDGAVFETTTRVEVAGAMYESKGIISNLHFQVEIGKAP